MLSTSEWVRDHRVVQQAAYYAETYRWGRRWRSLYFAARYGRRRLHAVARELHIDLESRDVLDVGFGGGHLLASFPASCRLHGAEVSRSAVEGARRDRRFRHHAGASFSLVSEREVEALPPGPFDVAVSSHVLEHVPDDAQLLAAISRRVRPGGWLFVFVPIEEADYNPEHRRHYSLESISERIAAAGLLVVRAEGGLHANGHLFRWLTIPSRRRWAVLGPVVDALRVVSLSLIPYRGHRALEVALAHLGFTPCQAFVVARRPA